MSAPDVIFSACMGIGLAAACGFRVFIPLLIAGLAFRLQMLPTTDAPWLANTSVLVALAIASVLEIAAYNVPVLGNFLDMIGAPMALGAGAVMTSTIFQGGEAGNAGFATILSLIAGAGSAGIIHGATAATRLASTKTTLGSANPIFALVESIASFLTSVMAILLPLIMGIVTVLAVVLAVYLLMKFRRRSRLA